MTSLSRMFRWVIVGGALGCATAPAEPTGDVTLTTDATLYQWPPNSAGLPPVMIPALRNDTRGDIALTVCGGPTVLTPLLWEKQQVDGSWQAQTFGTFTCPAANRQELVIPPGAQSSIPPGRMLPGTQAGTYRIKLAWGGRGLPATDTVVSNTYVVRGNYAP